MPETDGIPATHLESRSLVTHRPANWQARAACAGADPNLWFPERGDNGSAREAKAICGGCPVMRECLVAALNPRERWGIQGGAGGAAKRVLDRLIRTCAHDPVEVCDQAGCAWCRGVDEHRADLQSSDGGRRRVDGARPMVAFGAGAAHARRSTYARGCRCLGCRFVVTTVAAELVAVGVDVDEWLRDLTGWAPAAWSTVDDGYRGDLDRALTRVKEIAQGWLVVEARDAGCSSSAGVA